MRTLMRSLTQRLLDGFPAVGTVGTGVVGWHGNRYHPKHLAEILQPLTESRPCRIGDGFCQSPILNHVSYLQVLISNQVVRLDDAQCLLHGKIFTLPYLPSGAFCSNVSELWLYFSSLWKYEKVSYSTA